MPRVWLWVRKWMYEDLEREAAQRGIGVDDLILAIVEDYVKGRLRPAEACRQTDGGEIQALRTRIDRLEEEVTELRALIRSLLRVNSA